MTGNRSTVRHFIQFSYGSLAIFLLGFVTSPVFTRIFSPAEYGRQTIFVTLLSVLQVAAVMGVDQSFIRYFYTVPPGERQTLALRCLKVPLAASGAISAIIVISSPWLLPAYFDKFDVQIVVLLVASLFTVALQGFLMNVVRMNQHGRTFSNLQIFYKISNFIFIVGWALLFRPDVYAFLYGTLLSGIFGVILAWRFEKEFWTNWRKPREAPSVPDQRHLLLYGLPFLPASLIYMLMSYVGIFSLKTFSTIDVVGVFSVAGSLVAPLTVLRTAFSTFWIPVAFERVESGLDYKNTFISINDLMMTVLTVASVLLIAGRDIIVLILGPQFRDASDVMPFLIFVPFFYMLTDTVNIGLRLENKLKYCIPINVAALAVNVCCCVLLVPGYGASGAALSGALAYAAYYFMNMIVAEHFHPIGFSRLRNVIATVLLFALAACATFMDNDVILAVIALISVTVVTALNRRSLVWGLSVLKRKDRRTESQAC